MNIRRFNKEDINSIVAIHEAAFESFFLTSLGPYFLNELYNCIVEDCSSIALVAVDESEKIIGFVAGTTEPQGFYSRILKKRWKHFLIKSLPSLISRPAIIGRLIRAVNKPKDYIASSGDCELMSIAVLPENKGIGIGKILEKEFVDIAKFKKSRMIILSTDAEENEPVNHFYISCGYSLKETYITKEGRKMNRYIKQNITE